MLSRPSDILKLAVSSLLLFSFVCVNSAEESLAPEELAADIPLPGTGISTSSLSSDNSVSTAHKYTNKLRRSAYAAPSAEANVDRIKSVEIEPTQIVIITTKQGPVDSLKIHIELVDLKDNRTLPPVELFGLFLVVARGRYTIPFLKPERWYGLRFTSENELNGEANVHTETRLLRTASRQQTGFTPNQLYEVMMHRNLDGEESAERLYVTSKWTGQERVPHGELQVFVNVHCESSSTTEQMILHNHEDSITIEISMDLLYDIKNLNDTIHQVLAHITPLKCHKVCWQSFLLARLSSTDYRGDASQECRDIESTTSVTYLRHMKQYAIEKHASGFELVVDTELNEDTEEGFVTLSALNLAKDDSKPRMKTFGTASTNGTFHLPLSPDAVYAAQYQYTKVKPIHFTTTEHFLIETTFVNSSKSSYPLVVADFHTENRTRNDSEPLPVPFITFSRGDAYTNREVKLHLGPFCENKESSTEILSDAQSSFTINLVQAICSQSPNATFCEHGANYTKCGPILCYSMSVAVHGDEYPSDVRCHNVTQHFSLESLSLPCSRNFISLLILILLVI
uniref:Cadherin domain-containing protein n=1 Tax=Haemonchus contortus TaxID=6289 RepID=A0A7I5EAY5_HAECO